jgi:hypothetical protein
MGDRIGNGRPFAIDVGNGLLSTGRRRRIRMNRKMVTAGVAGCTILPTRATKEGQGDLQGDGRLCR